MNRKTMKQILTIRIHLQGEDQLKCTLTRSGDFSVNSMYQQLLKEDGIQPQILTEKQWLHFWHIKVPKKVLLFLWK